MFCAPFKIQRGVKKGKTINERIQFSSSFKTESHLLIASVECTIRSNAIILLVIKRLLIRISPKLFLAFSLNKFLYTYTKVVNFQKLF